MLSFPLSPLEMPGIKHHNPYRLRLDHTVLANITSTKWVYLAMHVVGYTAMMLSIEITMMGQLSPCFHYLVAGHYHTTYVI